jgi:predicted glycoside hydrolase/deacetylase ChbG (UPF0249 family)
MSGRRLIVNADDFGFTRDVNLGIVEAHERGILTATTLMANGAAFDHAVELARRHPALDVGGHLVLVGGFSLASPGAPLPNSVPDLLARLAQPGSTAWVERELTAQVEKLVQTRLEPSHLDTHKHTHLAPPVLQVVCRLAERFRIPWVRRPFDLPLTVRAPLATRAVNGAVGSVRRWFDAVLARHACRTTDHFAGFQLTGALRSAELVELIGALPEGLTELMCHPGNCTDELRHSHTRLKETRAEELQALLAPEVRQALEQHQVQLVNYRMSMQSP